MNDPEQTIGLPVVEFSGESNGTSPRWALHPKDATISPGETISPPKDTNTSHPKIAADAGPSRSGPSRSGQTVVDAVRRYRVMVIAVAILGFVVAVGYSLVQPKVYRAEAFITMPQQVSLQGQQTNPGQYLDGQVLLLQSQNVAQRAATIANATLHGNMLTSSDFYGSGSSLEISPPTTAAPGAYGATVVGVSFAASTAQLAQVGTNAVIQAYDKARSAAIRSQDNAAIAGIGNAIGGTNFQLAGVIASRAPNGANLEQELLAQRAALINQQSQALVNEQIDLAQQPSVATEPATTANHKWALDGGIGLVIGIGIGVALAYARASRRRRTIDDSSGSASRYQTEAAASSQASPLG